MEHQANWIQVCVMREYDMKEFLGIGDGGDWEWRRRRTNASSVVR